MVIEGVEAQCVIKRVIFKERKKLSSKDDDCLSELDSPKNVIELLGLKKDEVATLSKKFKKYDSIKTYDECLYQAVYELHLNGYTVKEIATKRYKTEKYIEEMIQTFPQIVTIPLLKSSYVGLKQNAIKYGNNAIKIAKKTGGKAHDIIAILARAKRLKWDVPRETLKKDKK